LCQMDGLEAGSQLQEINRKKEVGLREKEDVK
jgi:hypothetical protein